MTTTNYQTQFHVLTSRDENETLVSALENELKKWDDCFKLNPYQGFGYTSFTAMYEQAHDDIVGTFMCDKFNTFDELGRGDKDWQEIDEAQDFYELIACDLRCNADFRMREWVEENGNNLNEITQKYIKEVEYNNDLVGFILTLKNGKIVQIQFERERNRLHADFNTHFAHIDKENIYGLDLTDFEETLVNEFIRYNDEINEKIKELDAARI